MAKSETTAKPTISALLQETKKNQDRKESLLKALEEENKREEELKIFTEEEELNHNAKLKELEIQFNLSVIVEIIKFQASTMKPQILINLNDFPLISNIKVEDITEESQHISIKKFHAWLVTNNLKPVIVTQDSGHNHLIIESVEV